MVHRSPVRSTRAEHSSSRTPRAIPWLVYVGSPEDGFAEAGRVFPLGEIDTVRFGRSLTAELTAEVDARELHLSIPLAWVSGVHSELTVNPSGDTHRLKDLVSRNGTAIEGVKIHGEHAVSLGEVFEIGRSFWTIRETPLDLSADRELLDVSGTSTPRMISLLGALQRLARSDLPVLLTGETGTGKDYLARALHRASGLPGEFVRANLAAAPLERILWTGPRQTWDLVERARGGTLFLDEIGELAPEAQTHLLSFISGSLPDDDEGPRSVRLVAASSRDLEQMMRDEQFRPDLFARLSGYEAKLPPLRERREDLGRLVREALGQHSTPSPTVTIGAFRRMLAHSWPFNLRELRQTIRAALAVSEHQGCITRMALDEVLRSEQLDQFTPGRIQAVREELLRNLRTHGPDVDALASALRCPTEQVERWLRRFEFETKGSGPN